MKRYLLVSIVIFVSVLVKGQYNFNIIGEGTEKEVKLLWLPEKWYSGMDGVVIKRREVSKSGVKSDWVTLTQTPIRPGNWQDKDLSNVSNSQAWITDLKKLRTQLLNNTKTGTAQLKDIQEDYLKNELRSAEATKTLILMFAYDYDMSLLMGFGYVDTQYPKSHVLEYGIFPVINGNTTKEAVKVFKHNVGNQPDLDFTIKKSKIKRRNNVVSLKWAIDMKEFKRKENLIGFNIYRKSGSDDYIKINKQVIWINKGGDEGSLIFSDTISDENKAYTYGVTAVSIFKNESKKSEFAFQPQAATEDITPPILKCTDDPNTDFVSDGVSLEWTFKKEQESSIKGFVIERKLKSEDEFVIISDTLSESVRNYRDSKVPAPQSEHYIYRVSAVQDGSFPIFSDQVVLHYNPKKKIVRPANLTLEPKVINNGIFIHIKWAGDPEILKSIEGYTILCDRAWGIVAREAELPLIKGFEYDYKVEGVSGTKYLFAVAPVDKDGVMGESSDTLSVMVPTLQLPDIRIWPISTSGKKVIFEWKYPNDIPDLAGFRIYQNGTMIVDETSIKADQRSWTSNDLESGKYMYQIEAVSTYKIVSEKSTERYATIE